MDAQHLSRLTLQQAIDGYNAGTIGQVEYEAYRRTWAVACPYGNESPNVRGWLTPSDDPAMENLATDIAAAAAQRKGQ